jgi:hypothetical protein
VWAEQQQQQQQQQQLQQRQQQQHASPHPSQLALLGSHLCSQVSWPILCWLQAFSYAWKSLLYI